MQETMWLPVGIAVAVVLAVVVGGYLGYQHLVRDGDDHGHAFRDALVRTAASGGLREPVAVAPREDAAPGDSTRTPT